MIGGHFFQNCDWLTPKIVTAQIGLTSFEQFSKKNWLNCRAVVVVGFHINQNCQFFPKQMVNIY
jgi:hypothetical protein